MVIPGPFTIAKNTVCPIMISTSAGSARPSLIMTSVPSPRRDCQARSSSWLRGLGSVTFTTPRRPEPSASTTSSSPAARKRGGRPPWAQLVVGARLGVGHLHHAAEAGAVRVDVLVLARGHEDVGVAALVGQ